MDDDFDLDGTDIPHRDHDYEDGRCHTCQGQGWGIVGVDWDTDDGVNGPFDGDVVKCPNCHGSGKAEDCWYW